MQKKLALLHALLDGLGPALVSFSGGVDSTLVLKIARDAFGRDGVLAVTGRSATYPPEEAESAAAQARALDTPHLFIDTGELADSRFSANPPERCYYCKEELYNQLFSLAGRQGFRTVLDGTNADDALDHRPGLRAAAEKGVRSPLREAGLGKEDVRRLSRHLGLPNWDKPAQPCLSSRFPYGDTITAAKLRQVEEAERFLRSLGLPELRVRHHGSLARLEVPPGWLERLAASPLREEVSSCLQDLGFTYVCLDLKGFRSGSMNEVLGGACWKKEP